MKQQVYLFDFMQEVQTLLPSVRPTEGLNEKGGGSSLQGGESFPHDVVEVKHFIIMTATHTQR